MNKKVLLGAAISIASMQASAIPFAPTDARAMAMGGTGVAAAKTVHAVQFNPSLLSQGDESDDFGLLFPQMGGYVSDEDDFVESADDFVEADHVTSFENAVNTIETPINNIQNLITTIDNNSNTGGNLTVLSNATSDLAAQTTLLTTGTGNLALANQNLTGTNNGVITPGNTGLASLSGKALRGGLGFGAGVAIPSKKFSVAISANNSTTFSGVLRVAQSDLDTLTAYTDATDAYAVVVDDYAVASNAVAQTLTAIDTANTNNDFAEALRLTDDVLPGQQTTLSAASTALDTFSYGFGTNGAGNEIFDNGALATGADSITLDSEAHIIAVALTEVGLTISREFQFGQQPVAIGITPKLQRMDVYDYIVSVEEDVETDDITDFGTDDTGFNLDIGASMKFGAEDQGTVGIVAKNLLSNELESINGQLVEVSPQVRAGVAYSLGGWVNLAADIDLMENDPLAFEQPTQFAAFGAELDIFGIMQGRFGYRSNLAVSGQDVISGGFGFSPFGVHMDLGFYANTDDVANEAGLVFEAGIDW